MGFEGEPKIIDNPQALQFTIPRLQQDALGLCGGHDLDNGLDLQLEHLQLRDRVAVMAGAQGLELAGIEQGSHHPILLVEVGGQAVGIAVDG